jgi:hypothetical protein
LGCAGAGAGAGAAISDFVTLDFVDEINPKSHSFDVP